MNGRKLHVICAVCLFKRKSLAATDQQLLIATATNSKTNTKTQWASKTQDAVVLFFPMLPDFSNSVAFGSFSLD
jgi:hypothetical protein